MRKKRGFGGRGQVTLFIILAVLIVVGIIAYFSLSNLPEAQIPKDIEPVYDYYLSCLEENAHGGIALLGEQGGYIETPEFVPGSAYMPFSNQLDFFGQGVPYWMYVSGNNLLKEQVPTKSSMEDELNNYLNERLNYCDFSNFEKMGYDIYVGSGSVDSTINEDDVVFDVQNPVTIFYHNSSVFLSEHKINVKSKLGKFYKMARKVYDFEKSEMFLEDYALDVMRTYAPVTGTEIGCAPKIFVDSEIQENLKNGFVANIATLRLKGNYFELSSKERDYFVTDPGFSVDENVNFVYSSNFPTRIEIYGDRIAKPVGAQQGLGVLGFCYVPYHLVYDINFPVLVQFYDDNELFQFPVSVIISKNKAREALPSSSGVSIQSSECEFQNQNVEVYTYDYDLNPVEARLQFKCLNSVCEIGQTNLVGEVSGFSGNFPQCVNGFILASALGYADAKYQISTNEENTANIFLSKKYNVTLDLGDVNMAVVNFDSEGYSTSLFYPEMKNVELVEGDYNVSVYAYDNSSLKFVAINERKCVDVPESGLAGMIGVQTEKCYDINIPEMNIDFAIVGGGKTREYITSSILKDSTELNINVPLFGVPASVEELQKNSARIEDELIFLEW